LDATKCFTDEFLRQELLVKGHKMLAIAIVLQLVTGLFLLRAYRSEKREREMDMMLLNQISEFESEDN
jgi:hypothetical protein